MPGRARVIPDETSRVCCDMDCGKAERKRTYVPDHDLLPPEILLSGSKNIQTELIDHAS